MVVNIWDLYKEKYNFCIVFSVCVVFLIVIMSLNCNVNNLDLN